jgi:hypothetical protein
MASNVFTSGLAKVCGMATAIAYLADTLKAYLVDTTYVPNVDHDFMADVAEIGAVASYTPGWDSASHPTLASKTIATDDTNNRVVFDCADLSFGSPGTGETIMGWCVYKPITNAAASPVIVFSDLAADVPTNGAALTGVIDSTGLFYLQL